MFILPKIDGKIFETRQSLFINEFPHGVAPVVRGNVCFNVTMFDMSHFTYPRFDTTAAMSKLKCAMFFGEFLEWKTPNTHENKIYTFSRIRPK